MLECSGYRTDMLSSYHLIVIIMTSDLVRSLLFDYYFIFIRMVNHQKTINYNSFHTLFLCFSLIVTTPLVDASQQSIRVESNSYKDIVISFDPAIHTNLVSTLLDNLEEKIQQVSDSLYTATNQSLCFDEVIVLIPDRWSGKIGNRRINNSRSFTSLDTDIYINDNEKMFYEEPYTDQYGQCGVSGKLIHLSKQIFLEKASSIAGHGHHGLHHVDENTLDENGNIGMSNQNHNIGTNSGLSGDGGTDSKVKNILKQWVTYRYGVFSEHGFHGDKFHPDYISIGDRHIMTSCASNGKGESLDIVVQPLKSNSDCFSRPISDSFPSNSSCLLSTSPSSIVSSLMFAPRLSSVSTFCSEDNHDAFSPTKQNRLCDGKSINEVIRMHPDFRKIQPVIGNKCMTKFTLITEKRPRIAVFFDVIKTMDETVFLEPIRSLFNSYDPLVFQLKKNSARVLEATEIIYGHTEGEPVCFDCGMEQLRGHVKKMDKSITHLHIVTAGQLRTDSFPLESYATELTSYDIKVKIIIYPYKEDGNYTALMRFAKAASAELHVIRHFDTIGGSFTRNRKSFLESLYLSRDSLNPHDMVILSKSLISSSHPAMYSKEFSDHSHGVSFFVDSSLIEANYSIKVILICDKKDECAKRVQKKVLINNMEYDFGGSTFYFMENTYTFTVHPERHFDGSWNIQWFGLKQSSENYIVVIAIPPNHLSQPSLLPPRQPSSVPLLESEVLTGSCWTSPSRSIISDSSRERLYVYVSLNRKLYEYVHNVSVKIQFFDDFSSTPILEGEMTDDGLGDPDITQGDGIWSYLVTNLPTNKFIRAEVVVNSESGFHLYPGLQDRPCCGSSVPQQPVYHRFLGLDRVILCSPFYIESSRSEEKLIQVPRTLDVSVEVLDPNNHLITISFQNPSYRQFNISSIEEIKIFNWTERPYARTDFALYGVRISSALKLDGLMFIRELYLPKGTVSVSGPYVIAVLFKDIYGSKHLSNLVNIYLNGEPDLNSEPPGPFVQNTDSSDLFEIFNSAATGNRGGFFSDGNGSLGIWHITSILVGSFIFILLSLLFIICLVAGRRRRGGVSGHHSRSTNGDSKDVKNKLPPSSMGTENPDKSVYRSYSDELLGVKGVNSDLGPIDHFTTNQSSHNQTLNHQQQLQHQQQQLNLHHHHHHQSQQQLINNQSIYQNESPKLMEEGVVGISPIDSIPANKLLSHYDKVKQAKQRNEPLPVMRIEDIVDLGSINNVSSVSDNDSRFRGSVTGLPDEPFGTMANDLNSWRYPTPVVDQYQYCYTPHTNYVPNNSNNNMNNVLPSTMITWRNSYDGSETTSDYDPRYGTVDKSTNAVSQV